MYLFLIISIHSILMLFSIHYILKSLILPNRKKGEKTALYIKAFWFELKIFL